MLKAMIKLLDILVESMADGKAFQAFVDHAIAKQETQANEGLNLAKKPHEKKTNFVSDNHNIPYLSFDFDRVEEDDDTLWYYGITTYGDMTFSTGISTDLNGKYIGFDATLDEDTAEFEQGEELLIVAEGLEHELNVFFSDVIDQIKNNE